MESVGIRMLKQNASAVIAGVAAGGAVTVTDRGRPVAQIVPLPASPIQQLVASGRARQAKSDLADLPEPQDGPDLSGQLERLRDDERF